MRSASKNSTPHGYFREDFSMRAVVIGGMAETGMGLSVRACVCVCDAEMTGGGAMPYIPGHR